MKGVIRHILNPDIPLRDRLFQLLSVIALAEFMFVSAYTVLFSGDTRHVILMLAGTAVFAATVAFTFRSGKRRAGAAVSGLIYYLMYPLTFFASGGMYGGAPAVFAFALVYVFLVTQKWERAACLAFCVLCSAACYLISYLRPEMLDRHTPQLEHVESLLSILLVTLLLCALFAFVTEVYRTENRIVQKQKKEIEELNQAQKRFFSSVSHEIRTPVNAIIGLNEATLRENLPEEARENARHIEAAGRMLLHTVNDILDLSRLETGSMEIVAEDYGLAAMLSDAAGLMAPRAREKGLEFTVQADPNLPAGLRGDEMRVKQILLNVLSNAIKYTREGSVRLSVNSAADAAGGFLLVCEVADTGIGIREEDIPGLFTAFRRADERENRSIEGTGLGLSIVKLLLDRMGGAVRVASEYGKGSVFHIEIPQQVADAAPMGDLGAKKTAPAAEEPTVLQAPPIRLLAVDDTPMNLKVIQKLLRGAGAAVDTALSGAEAVEMTQRARYDVILMDHQMPGMDGIECLHAIRAQKDGLCRDSRIVCLTANADADMRERCLREGFDGYMTKPVRGKDLEAELARLTAGH